MHNFRAESECTEGQYAFAGLAGALMETSTGQPNAAAQRATGRSSKSLLLARWRRYLPSISRTGQPRREVGTGHQCDFHGTTLEGRANTTCGGGCGAVSKLLRVAHWRRYTTSAPKATAGTAVELRRVSSRQPMGTFTG